MNAYSNNDFTITNHAYARAKERCGWKKKTLDRMARIAYKKGLERKDLTSSTMIAYIDYIRSSNSKGFVMFYGKHVYIFAGSTLLTLFSIKKQYEKLIDKEYKKRKKK